MTSMVRKLLTLLLVRDIENRKILLGYKKRGFGKDKWNGFGGKVEPNETILDAAKRETKEESGLEVIDSKQVAYIEFQFDDRLNEVLQVHVFTATKYLGEIRETDEMIPKWFDIDKIPFDDMWTDDRTWVPYVLDNKPFKAYFLFKSDEKTIIKHEMTLVDSF